MLANAKNKFASSRPNGGGSDSMAGENFNDFMNSSPQLKITQSRAGGSGSRSTSPNQDSSPLLQVQEMLALQNQGSEVQNTSNLLKGIDIAINQKKPRTQQRSEATAARAEGTNDHEDGGDIDIDIDDIEC